MAAFANIWHLRKVADTSAKSCDICFKPSTSVLITPDNKDFFYVCLSHLQDKSFATSNDGEASAAAAKKAELEREIEKIKLEYEEKLKKKKQNKKAKEKKKDDKEEKDSKEDAQDVDVEKEKNDKINALNDKSTALKEEETPRIYTLQKVFYQKRLDRLKSLELAKRNRERAKDPLAFPMVPKGDLG